MFSKQLRFRLVLASMTALVSTRIAHAQQIPLDVVFEGGTISAYRLGISVGVNGLQAKEYMLDTGSDSFNIDVGTGSAANAWFPGNAGQTPVANLTPYMYGDGTYGYLLDNTTVSSVQFYNSTSGAKVAEYGSSQGYNVSAAPYWIATTDSLGGDQAGIQINNPTLTGYGFTTQPYYQDLSWQQALDTGQPPEEGKFYGTFGAGDFVYQGDNGGIPGQITSTGYIVEANGQTTTPGSCGQACMIVGLTPQLRAQFFNVLPWTRTSTETFPVSGAHASHEFDVLFNYTIGSGGKAASGRLVTLLDSGTPSVQFNSDALLKQAQAAGLINAAASSNAAGTGNAIGNVYGGNTLTVTGAGAGNQSYSITTNDDYVGDMTNAVNIDPSDGGTPYAINGIGFYFHNAVMYDLQNQATGYTPFSVTADNFSNGLNITSDMGPLGVAGVISGSNGVNVGPTASLFLTGANTYTGATTINSAGWLGVGGPGSIAQSSSVRVDGTLDILHSDGEQTIRSLEGTSGGTVILGSNTLVLSNTTGIFSGSIRDFYPADAATGRTPYPVVVGPETGTTGDQHYGGVIIANGAQTFTGDSTYSGNTGIGQNASLWLTGTLENSAVINAGTFENDGTTRAAVLSSGTVTGGGNFAGGLHVVSGVVSPGISYGTVTPTTAFGTPRIMTVGGNLTLDRGATYYATVLGTQAGRIAVNGTATINGATLRVHSNTPHNGDVIATAGPLTAATLAAITASSTPAPALGQSYTVLTATGGITGRFAALGSNLIPGPTAFPFLSLSPDYTSNSVSVDVTRSTVAFTNAAQTRNEYAVASALDGMNAYGSVPRPITALNFAGARTAFNALSGELHASARTAMIQDSYAVRNAVVDRLRVTECALGSGASGMKSASYQHGHRMDDDGACHDDRPALWMQSYGEWSHNGSSSNARGMSQSTGGFILGGDAPIAGKWHLGGVFTYGYSGFSTEHDAAGNGHSHNVSLGAYAGRHWGALGLRLAATYTWNMLSTNRTIAFAGYHDRANGRYDGGTAQAFADLGYRFTLKRVSIEPFGNVAYINQQMNAFNETAGGASALHGHDQNTGVTFATFGTRFATRTRIGRVKVEPNLSLGYRHAFGTLTPTVRENFTSGSAAFETGGIPLLKDAAVINAGVQANLTDRININVGYTGQYGSRFNESGLRGTFSLRF